VVAQCKRSGLRAGLGSPSNPILSRFGASKARCQVDELVSQLFVLSPNEPDPRDPALRPKFARFQKLTVGDDRQAVPSGICNEDLRRRVFDNLPTWSPNARTCL
jgi:hypothetical protein